MLQGKRRAPERVEEDDDESYNMIEFTKSSLNKYQRVEGPPAE